MATVKHRLIHETKTCDWFVGAVVRIGSDENPRRFAALGNAHQDKRRIRYHRRSLAETTMFRHKAAFGGKVRSKKFNNQAVEILLQCAALNRMIQLAKPDTIWVDD